MKKLMLVGLILGSTCLISISSQAQQIASQVKFYFYPVPLPNSDNTLEFGTARDNLLAGIKYGGSSFTTSGSRVGTNAANVTAIEFRNVFETPDITVSSVSNLWRGQFYPSAPYHVQFGNRPYVAVLMVGQDGKVNLDRTSYKVTCGAIPLLGNNSSLSGLSNSVSRIGINAGQDGILFTADDQIVTSGSGTNLYDAIAFIGGRIGAVANSQADINTIDSAIGSGTWINWEYDFNGLSGLQTGSVTIPLYQSGQIPWASQYNRLVPFVGPNGVLFSLVSQYRQSPLSIFGSRVVTGPFSSATSSATEGTSVYWPFTMVTTNDMGFYFLGSNSLTLSPSAVVINSASHLRRSVGSLPPIVSAPSTESDQDK